MDIKFQVEFFVAGEPSARHVIFCQGSELIPQVGDGVQLPKEESGPDSFIVYERRFILAQHGTNDREATISQVRIQVAPKLP